MWWQQLKVMHVIQSMQLHLHCPEKGCSTESKQQYCKAITFRRKGWAMCCLVSRWIHEDAGFIHAADLC